MTKIVQFSVERFNRSIKLMGKILLCIIALAFTVLMLGGQEMIGGGKDFTTFEHGGIYLFPGSDLLPAEIFYYIFIGIFAFFSPLIGFLCVNENRTALEKCFENALANFRFAHGVLWFCVRPYYCIFSIPVFLAILHFLANLHWQFYCAVGIIPEQNCFWVFDYRSLLIGFAGTIELLIILSSILLLSLLARTAYRIIKWCCCFVVVEEIKTPV